MSEAYNPDSAAAIPSSEDQPTPSGDAAGAAGTRAAWPPSMMSRAVSFARERWLSIDLRTLGLFRIAFGICLMANLIDHAAGGNLTAFFSNDGTLTNHFALFAPIQQRVWSLLFAFSRPEEVAVAFAGIFVVFFLYTIGWRTKLMQVLTLICFISILNRNLLLQDGGSFTCTVLAVWTLFLPLGARFSVDAWLAARAGNDGPAPTIPPRHVSFVCLALLLQLAAIYGMNAANKSGATWREGTAVHYILWLNSRNTWLAGLLRFHEPSWFSPLLTRGTLAFEWSAPVLALCPVFQTPLRRLLIASMWCFHLGIALLMSLGPFAYAMMTYSILLLGPKDWAVLEPRATRLWARLVRRAPALPAALAQLRARVRPPVSGLALNLPESTRAQVKRTVIIAREAVAVVLLILMAVELTLANGAVPGRLRLAGRPAWIGDVLYYMRVYQMWSMFAPDAPRTDGMIVVDATLADGSHQDPLTGQPPDFEAPLGGPCGYDHDWSEYIYYFPWDRHRAYRNGLRDYILTKSSQATPDQRIRSFEAFWVSADLPPPGETQARNLKRESLLTFDGGR